MFKSKAFVVAGVATLSAMAALPAQAITGFTGPYAPTNWSDTLNDGGSINTSGAPGSITFNLPTLDVGNLPSTIYSTVSQGSGQVSFNWSSTNNNATSMDSIQGKFILNGTEYDFLDNYLSDSGSGSYSVSTGDTFGFRFETNNFNGPSSLTISNFSAPSAPTPPAGVPGPLPLFGAGAAYGWSRRLRRRLSNPQAKAIPTIA